MVKLYVKQILWKIFVTLMMFDKSLNSDMKVKISNTMSTPRKAVRNRFVNLLGYPLMFVRVISKYIVSITQKKEYENQKREFREKVLKETESSALITDYGERQIRLI